MILKTPLYGNLPSRQSPIRNNHNGFLFLASQEFFSEENTLGKCCLTVLPSENNKDFVLNTVFPLISARSQIGPTPFHNRIRISTTL